MAQNAKAVSIFDAIVGDNQRSITNAKKMIAIARKQRARILKLVTPLIQLLPTDDSSLSVSVNDWSGNDMVHVYVSLYNVGSMRCDLVVDVLDYVTGLFDQPTDETSTRDMAEHMNRDFKFRSDANGLSATVAVYVKEDSPTCKKVVVGQETKLVNKYVLVCN